MINFWNVVSIKKLSFEKFNTKNLCEEERELWKMKFNESVAEDIREWAADVGKLK